MAEVLIRLENISKKFGNNYVIKNLSLDIYEGEFITLLGPSGCGKTTILRMISGLEKVTEGKIFLEGKDITDVPTADRNVNTIFQNFALFPHMNVWDNINFGLKMKKLPSEEAIKRIKNALKIVKLEGFEKRFPKELSGGQQQRVAIARGIVMNHKVLLLDESLASLDLKLKREMQIELKKIQKKLGMTFIYVTHDQDEALTMSDRIAIINRGTIEQLGKPEDIYRKPSSIFAADFIGESNIIDVEINKIDKNYAYLNITDNITIKVKNKDYELNEKLKIIIRPESFVLSSKKFKDSFKGILKEYIYDGSFSKLVVEIGNEKKVQLKVTVSNISRIMNKKKIYLSVAEKNIVIIKDKK